MYLPDLILRKLIPDEDFDEVMKFRKLMPMFLIHKWHPNWKEILRNILINLK